MIWKVIIVIILGILSGVFTILAIKFNRYKSISDSLAGIFIAFYVLTFLTFLGSLITLGVSIFSE